MANSTPDDQAPRAQQPGNPTSGPKRASGGSAGGYPGAYPTGNAGSYPGTYPGAYSGRYPSGERGDDDDVIDLLQLAYTLLRHWRSIVGLGVVVSMLATFYALSATPIFSASATVMIDSQKANTVSIDEVYGLPTGSREYLSTQFEVIKSRDIAVRAVEKLNLVNHPLYRYREPEPSWLGEQWSALRQFLVELITFRGEAPVASPDASRSQQDLHLASVAGRFMAALTITPIRNTSLITIAFESPDPALAGQVPNVMATVYVESQLDAELDSTRAAGSWLSSRVGELYSTLSASQEALQAFRDQENLIDIQGIETLGVQELQELTSRLGEARRARALAETVYQEVQLTDTRNTAELMQSPVVLKHPLVQGPATAESDAAQAVERLAKRYGPEHPKMIQAKTSLDGARLALRARVEQVIAGIASEYRIAKANEASLLTQMASVKSEVSTLNRQQFRLQELERKVDADQRLYEMFFNRVRETSEVMGFQDAPARIVEHAVVPQAPVKPRKGFIVGLAALLALLAGAALALLAEAMNRNIRSPEDVFTQLQESLLAVVPLHTLTRDERTRPYFGFIKAPNSVYAEAFRTLRTGLLLGREDDGCQVIMVTSAGPGEGKTSTSINLGYALSAMGRTLLIEADLRKPSLHRHPEIKQTARVGLGELLTGEAQLADALLILEANVHVLFAGKPKTRNSLELLSSKAFSDLLGHVREHYDYVIIDSPPLGLVTDALVLARHADSVVMVVRSGTSVAGAAGALDRLRQGGFNLAGVVLNMLDSSATGYNGSRYGAGYGYGYGYGYGHGSQAAYGAEDADNA